MNMEQRDADAIEYQIPFRTRLGSNYIEVLDKPRISIKHPTYLDENICMIPLIDILKATGKKVEMQWDNHCENLIIHIDSQIIEIQNNNRKLVKNNTEYWLSKAPVFANNECYIPLYDLSIIFSISKYNITYSEENNILQWNLSTTIFNENTGKQENIYLITVGNRYIQNKSNTGNCLLEEAPYIKDNLLMIPMDILPCIFENEVSIDYHSNTMSAIIHMENFPHQIVELKIDSNVMLIDGVEVNMTGTTVSRANHVYIPIRDIIKIFDLPNENLSWDEKTSTALLRIYL